MLRSALRYIDRFRWLWFGISLMLLCACAGKPVVHLYAKYLSPEIALQLQSQLESHGFVTKTNHFDTPVSITQNTALYSLMLKDAATLCY